MEICIPVGGAECLMIALNKGINLGKARKSLKAAIASDGERRTIVTVDIKDPSILPEGRLVVHDGRQRLIYNINSGVCAEAQGVEKTTKTVMGTEVEWFPWSYFNAGVQRHVDR